MTPTLLVSTATLLLTLDLIGTFVFALIGAASGVKHGLDAFGVGVLAFVAFEVLDERSLAVSHRWIVLGICRDLMFNQTVRPMLWRSTLARAHRGRRHRCEAFGDDA